MTTPIEVTAEQAEEDFACGEPCHPDAGCEYCESYWQRMRDDGLWVDGVGWTDKAVKSWSK